MFSIDETVTDKLELVRLSNIETGEFLTVTPKYGARIVQLSLQTRSGLKSILDSDKTEKEIIQNKWYKNCLLIPFANRINKAKYNFNSKSYTLDVNFPKQAHAIHGLVYNKKFSVLENNVGKNSCSLSLYYTSEGKTPGYPFKFSLKVVYTLLKKSVSVAVNVKNQDAKPIPLSVGYHPYFILNGKVNNLSMRLPVKWRILVDKNQIPTGEKEVFTEYKNLKKIGSLNIDDCFLIYKQIRKEAVTSLYNPRTKEKLDIWQETGKNKFNYLQVFIPPNRNSIAIEPMTGNIDAFNNGEGLITLSPKQEFNGSFGIVSG